MALRTFGYYGGKQLLAGRIAALLPRDARHYVEVCGGSGAVLASIDPRFEIETWNDVDGVLVNFFRVLREQPEALHRAADLTPYARTEQALAVDEASCPDPVERARRFLFRTQAAMQGAYQDTSFRVTTRSPRSDKQPARAWRSLVARLPALAERFHGVQIESKPAHELIRLFDAPHVVFYVDPPYPDETCSSSRRYPHPMDTSGHVALAAALHRIKGRALVSGYPSKLYNRLYSGWRRVDVARKHIPASLANNGQARGAEPRTDSVWCSF